MFSMQPLCACFYFVPPTLRTQQWVLVSCLPASSGKQWSVRTCEPASDDVGIRIFAMRQYHLLQPLCPALSSTNRNIHEHRFGCPSHRAAAKPRHSFATSSRTRDSGHALSSPSSDTRPCRLSNTAHRVEYTNTSSTDRHSNSRKSRESFDDYVGAHESS
jgi:hypothetical protein